LALIRAVLLTVAGLVGLSLFCWFVWPPLAFLPSSIAAVLAGLLIDWEAQRGKSAPSHRPEK